MVIFLKIIFLKGCYTIYPYLHCSTRNWVRKKKISDLKILFSKINIESKN